MKPLTQLRTKPLAREVLIACGYLGLALPLPVAAQTKPPSQVVKPPIAMAYIDVATNGSDMPGGNMMNAMASGGQSGGLFGSLGGLAKGAVGGTSDRGNTFGNTHAMGFGSGKYIDISVFTKKNSSLSEATQTLPSVMLLGESLKLRAPIADKPVPTVVDENPIEPTYEKPKGKISIYWGCGANVRPGQPRTLDVAKASPEDYAKIFTLRGSTTKGARSQPGHPAWPNKQDDRKVPDNASLFGQHTFTGDGIPDSFKVTLGASQDLMPQIELNQAKIDGGFKLEWKSIPHARGYFVSVMGAKSDGGDSAEMIVWTSSELPDMGFGLIDYQSNANIDKWIKENVILPASATTCTVPKGIFGDQSSGMLRMIAYGSEAFFAYPPRPTNPKTEWAPDWSTKVRVKSTFTSMLGGLAGGNETSKPGDQGAPAQGDMEEKKITPGKVLKGLFGF